LPHVFWPAIVCAITAFAMYVKWLCPVRPNEAL
jgi:hypothetical protein